jgi:sugar-specific transcriptional regulator TrmB
MAEERVKKAAEKLVELYWEVEKEMFLVHAEGCYDEKEFRQDLMEDTERGLYHLIVIMAAGDSDRIEHIIAELWNERNWRYGELEDNNHT